MTGVQTCALPIFSERWTWYELPNSAAREISSAEAEATDGRPERSAAVAKEADPSGARQAIARTAHQTVVCLDMVL